MEEKYGFFNYFCADKNWKKNFIIGTLIYCFSDIIVDNYKINAVNLIIPFIVFLFLFGWQTCTTNKRILKKDAGFFDFKKAGHIFLTGLKSLGGYFVYGLISGALVYIVLLLFQIPIQNENHSLRAFTIVILPLILISLILFLMYCAYSAYLAFCFDLKSASFFDYKKIRVLMKKGMPEIICAILKIFALTLIALFLIFVISIIYGAINAFIFIKLLGVEAVTKELVLGFSQKTSFFYCAPISFYLTALSAEVDAGCLRKIISKNTSSEDENLINS